MQYEGTNRIESAESSVEMDPIDNDEAASPHDLNTVKVLGPVTLAH